MKLSMLKARFLLLILIANISIGCSDISSQRAIVFFENPQFLEQEKLLKKTEQDSQGHGLGSLILMNLEVVLKIKKLMKHGIKM